MDGDPARRTRCQRSMPTGALATVSRMQSSPGSPPTTCTTWMGCVLDAHAHVERHPVLRASGRVAQRIRAAPTGSRHRETVMARRAYYLERRTAGCSALATFWVRKLSNGELR